MRRRIRKRILESLHTMREAQEIAVNMLLNGQAADAGGLLLQCQEGAQKIGESIEQSEGEGTRAVSCLEEYCEILYQISRSTDERQVAVYQDQLDRILQQAEYEVKEHLPVDRLKVVFLPYKASMWDSFESVWEAAKKDEGCDAYVMPIPYYDKNLDGSLGKMHDESACYPEYVPVLDWREHDLEKCRPDVIYIHNPYDQCNLVTSVHPDFYAERLSRITDRLVYIPYFIHQNDTVREEYCVLPGTIYSDVVVLQSEKVRRKYIEEYRKVAGNKTGLEKKFVAYGSPKLDFRDNSDRETNLPEDWRRVIYEKGKRKKVIFLNTHLSMLMTPYCEDFFKKLETIFEVFRRNRKVVLLWRPHPLSEATVESMNPEAASRYAGIIKSYQEEQIGIYDMSSDLHRAVNASDAYYGNRSSVTELFKAAGKPVMIMNHRLHVTGGERGNISIVKAGT